MQASPIRSSALLAAITFSRALNGVVVLKLVATFTSAAEFGFLSQFMGILALIGMLGAGGVANGLTRQLAAGGNATSHGDWLFSAWTLLAWVSAGLALFIFFGSRTLASSIFGDTNYVIIFLVLGIGQTMIGVSNLAQSIATAHGNYAWILRNSILSAVIGALIVWYGVSVSGMFGAAAALVFNACVPGVLALLTGRSAIRRWRPIVFASRLDFYKIGVLLQYAGASLLGALSLSLSQLAGRALLGDKVGWAAVGLWQAATRVSDLSMQFVSIFLIGYALPRLSKFASYRAMSRCLMGYICVLVTGFILIAICITKVSGIVLALLFSKGFIAAGLLLPWQFIGDGFRIIAVCISTAMLARGNPGIPMIYEAIQGVLFFCLLAILLKQAESFAPVQAYAATYFVLSVAIASAFLIRRGKEGLI